MYSRLVVQLAAKCKRAFSRVWRERASTTGLWSVVGVRRADCAPCYDWVQQQVRAVRRQLTSLSELIADVITRPPQQQQLNDTDYVDQLMAVNETVSRLWNDSSVYGQLRLG